MHPVIKTKLTEKREQVNIRFEAAVKSAEQTESPIINSRKFFFTVVANYFEELSKVKVNRILKDDYHFVREFNIAVSKAEYAIAKPARERNKQYFINN